MSNINEQLHNVKGNTLDSVRVMELLDLTADDFVDPLRFSKFQIIMDKLSRFPNKELVIKKITLKKLGEDKLSLLFEYLQTDEIKKAHEEELQKVTESKDILVKFSEEKGIDVDELEEYKEHLSRIKELTDTIGNLNEEISIYEN